MTEKKKRKRKFKDRKNIITLCERHVINRNHEYFEECDRLTFLAKNLYNATLYVQRQSFFNPEDNFKNYYVVNKEFRDSNQVDYRMLPAKVSQQIQMLSDRAFKSFFALLKLKAKGKYDKDVKIPGYLDKTKGFIELSKTNIIISTKVKKEELVGARIVPKGNHFIIEVLYDKEKHQIKEDFSRVAFIDTGLNNLMTVTSNVFNPIIYNGRPIKAINQLANKKSAKRQSKMGAYKITPQTNNKTRIELTLIPRLKVDKSELMKSIWSKRANRINDYFHKTSTHLVNHLVSHNIKTVIIGHNKGQKQDINLGSKTNQNFVYIPFTKMISMLSYKCLLAGINFIITEESYTSKCSFVDRETIKNHEDYCGSRIERGLFQTKNGKKINADINGSLNIGRKYLENINEYTDELHNQLLAFMVNPKKITI